MSMMSEYGPIVFYLTESRGRGTMHCQGSNVSKVLSGCPSPLNTHMIGSEEIFTYGKDLNLMTIRKVNQ